MTGGDGLSQRDLDVLRVVARLGRAPSNHIYELAFTSSRPTLYAVLKRLVKLHYLRVSDRRYGDTSGSNGQYIYALGRAGWATMFPDKPFVSRAVLNDKTLHTLMLADIYVDVVRLQRRGVITVNELLTEPDSHRKYDEYLVQSDMYLDVTTASNRLRLYLEADRGKENKTQVRKMLNNYWNAYVTTWPRGDFPRPLFIVPDSLEWRATELRMWFSQRPEPQRDYWRVVTRSQFVDRLSR